MLNRIACGAFQNCSSLKNILFPDGLEEIGRDAFRASGLKGITFPASLKAVAQGAFTKCKNLKTVTFDAGLEVLGTEEYTGNKK